MCRSISLAASILSICSFVAPLHAAVSPAGLRCEYHASPLAVDTPQPRLSWILKSGPEERDQAQSAYQILVATAPALLEPGKADLWDSGRVASSESAQIAYAGKPLASRAACYWTLRVWDKDGKASAWSEPASWSMGFMQQSDWKAQWIGGPEVKGELEQPGYLPAVYLRKTFAMKGAPKRAVVYVTAAGVYELHVNGKRVGNDFFTPGWNQYDKRLFYHAYDVTGLLRDGDNALGAVLGDGWFGLHHNGRGKLGPARPVAHSKHRRLGAGHLHRFVLASHMQRPHPHVGYVPG